MAQAPFAWAAGTGGSPRLSVARPTVDDMRKLSTAGVQAARAFVERSARPLEQVQVAHLFGEASADDLAQALAAFTTEDGGIGRAIEPDCRAPQASALGALTALDVLRMHGVPFDHARVGQICDWLVRAVQTDAQGRFVWPFLPPAAQEAAHAPWWDQSEPGLLRETFNGFLANPGIALTTHLWRREAAVPGSVPAELLAALSRQAREVADTGVDAQEVNAHDAMSHFAAEPAVPAPEREQVAGYLRRVLPQRVMARPQDYLTYGIHPLWIAPYPDHPLASDLGDALELALDQTVAGQQPDGSWAPFWDWGGWHPDVWAVAEVEWRGRLVARNLAGLLAHSRVEVD